MTRTQLRSRAVRQMIMELRNSLIVTPGDMEHYEPIMGPVLDRYADAVARSGGSPPEQNDG